jgi:hypothetical protein
MRTVVLAAFAYLSAFTVAHAAGGPETNPLLLWEIKELALRCVVQPYHLNHHGKKVLEPLTSVCSELQVYARGATLEIRNETLRATLRDAAHSDGGDLDDLLIYNTGGAKVAERRNVPSFNNIFVALAGGTTEFRLIRRR